MALGVMSPQGDATGNEVRQIRRKPSCGRPMHGLPACRTSCGDVPGQTASLPGGVPQALSGEDSRSGAPTGTGRELTQTLSQCFCSHRGQRAATHNDALHGHPAARRTGAPRPCQCHRTVPEVRLHVRSPTPTHAWLRGRQRSRAQPKVLIPFQLGENTFGFFFKPTSDQGQCCNFDNTRGPLGTAFKPSWHSRTCS